MRYAGEGCGGAGFRHARWRGRGADVGAAVPVVDAGARVSEVLGKLELNQRQREEADQVFARIAQVLGADYGRWARAELALSAASGEEFDRGAASAAFDLPEARRAELVDELEHLHTILTSEQRARLAQELGRSAL
jgi:hypothetical protein